MRIRGLVGNISCVFNDVFNKILNIWHWIGIIRQFNLGHLILQTMVNSHNHPAQSCFFSNLSFLLALIFYYIHLNKFLADRCIIQKLCLLQYFFSFIFSLLALCWRNLLNDRKTHLDMKILIRKKNCQIY